MVQLDKGFEITLSCHNLVVSLHNFDIMLKKIKHLSGGGTNCCLSVIRSLFLSQSKEQVEEGDKEFHSEVMCQNFS